jgi:hypothetical protein
MTDTTNPASEEWSEEASKWLSDAIDRLESGLMRESDRGGVLIAAAMLEEALRDLIFAHLVPCATKEDSLLDGPNSAFGSFATKIDGAFRLGLISGTLTRDLHIVRKLRNDVAHAPSDFSYDDHGSQQRIAELCKSHGVYDRSPDYVAWKKENREWTARHRFIESATYMLLVLMMGLREVKVCIAHAPERLYTEVVPRPVVISSGPPTE